MKTQKIILFAGFIFLSLWGISQTAPPMLTAGDVDRFIKTVRPMSDEFENMGMQLEGQNQDFFGSLANNQKAMAILKKYGWDEKVGLKWVAIGTCYAKIKMDEQLASLPADQREQMKKMMGSATNDLFKSVNAEDMKLVKAKLAQIDAVMDEN